MSDAIKWLEDCGWRGWTEDQLTGEITTSHGDTFKDAHEFRGWLSEQRWPRPRNGGRNVPKKTEDLVTAAPEMLAELKSIVDQSERNPFLAIGMLVEHHSKIREVIAKTEGKNK